MIAHLGQIWVEKETGNYIILRKFLGDQWIGDYHSGPIMDRKTFNVNPNNFIRRILIRQIELFQVWDQL